MREGLRQTVTVADVLVLARALGVPPLLLIFPLGSSEAVEVMPGQEIPTWQAAKWFMGDQPYPTRADDRWVVAGDDWDDWDEGPAQLVVAHRGHDAELSAWNTMRARALASRRAAQEAATAEEEERNYAAASASEDRMRDVEDHLRALRPMIRRTGGTPPPLGAELAHVDEEARP